MSKFPINTQITQGNQRDNISGYSKKLVLRETNVASGLQKASGEPPKLRVGKNALGVSVISIENESEEVKSKVNRDEVGNLNNPESSLVSAGFQIANVKKISISKKSQISVQNILKEFQDNLQETNYETELKDMKARMSIKSMESKFRKTANSSTQIANKTGFQAMCEKGKKTFKHSTRVNEAFIENGIEEMENKVTFKVHQDNVGKLINPGSSLVREKRMNEYPSCSSKLSAAGPILCRKRLLSLSLNPKYNYRPPPQLCETPNRNKRQTETTTPELGEFINNAVKTSIPGANRPKRGRLSGLRLTGISPKK
ncbi:uncharacterized protein ACN427_002878 isoform 1-T3 [Glossina fuscipes fuscipes]